MAGVNRQIFTILNYIITIRKIFVSSPIFFQRFNKTVINNNRGHIAIEMLITTLRKIISFDSIKFIIMNFIHCTDNDNNRAVQHADGLFDSFRSASGKSLSGDDGHQYCVD